MTIVLSLCPHYYYYYVIIIITHLHTHIIFLGLVRVIRSLSACLTFLVTGMPLRSLYTVLVVYIRMIEGIFVHLKESKVIANLITVWFHMHTVSAGFLFFWGLYLTFNMQALPLPSPSSSSYLNWALL